MSYEDLKKINNNIEEKIKNYKNSIKKYKIIDENIKNILYNNSEK